MANTAIRTAGRILSPSRSIMVIAELAHCPRSTVKSWVQGRRRPPVEVLRMARKPGNSRHTDGFDAGSRDHGARTRATQENWLQRSPERAGII
jgi:hypothetical protein